MSMKINTQVRVRNNLRVIPDRLLGGVTKKKYAAASNAEMTRRINI